MWTRNPEQYQFSRPDQVEAEAAPAMPTRIAMNYFGLAVALTRAEAAPTLARVAQKAVALTAIKARSDTTCCCSAYAFIHRTGSGGCPGTGTEQKPKS